MTERSKPHPTAVRIGLRIRALRLYRGLSMLELGDAAGMAAGNISRLERGLTMPTIEVIERLAKGLNTFAAHIVNDRDKGPAEFAIERLCMELMASSTPRRPNSPLKYRGRGSTRWIAPNSVGACRWDGEGRSNDRCS